MNKPFRVTAVHRYMPYPYGNLSTAARMLIGLTRYTTASEEAICRIMEMNPQTLRRFWKAINHNVEGRCVISGGLPAMFGEMLPEDIVVNCLHCGRKISSVPCVTCCVFTSIEFVDRNDFDRLDNPEVELMAVEAVTDHLPGSRAKIEVMRFRLENGYHLYHENDAVPDL